MKNLFILFVLLLFNGCTSKNCENKIDWYNEQYNIGVIKNICGHNALDGRHVKGYFFTLEGNDTLYQEIEFGFGDLELIDSNILLYKNERNFGYSYGWFNIKEGKKLEFNEVEAEIKNLPDSVKYHYRNGMIIEKENFHGIYKSKLEKPVLDYGDINNIEKPQQGQCIIYELVDSKLKCVAKTIDYEITKNGIYYIPYPGLVKHKYIPVSKLKEKIKENPQLLPAFY